VECDSVLLAFGYWGNVVYCVDTSSTGAVYGCIHIEIYGEKSHGSPVS